jgi:hypothetical protein
MAESEQPLKAVSNRMSAVSGKNGKALQINAYVNDIGEFTSNGIVNRKNESGNIDISISNLEEMPTLNQSIDLNNITKKSVMLDLLKERATNGILTDGLILTGKEIKALEDLGLNDTFGNVLYAVGKIKSEETVTELGSKKRALDEKGKKTKVSTTKQAQSKAAFVRYDEVAGHLKNAGLDYTPEEKDENIVTKQEGAKLRESGNWEVVKNKKGETFLRNKSNPKELKRIN